MKRSGFLNRGKGFTTRSPLTRSRMRGVGKKSLVWTETRKELKARFEAAGILICELGYGGCWRDNALSFCHSKKRRHITTQEQLEEVCLGCTPCHDKLEVMSDMEMVVLSIIAQRERQP